MSLPSIRQRSALTTAAFAGVLFFGCAEQGSNRATDEASPPGSEAAPQADQETAANMFDGHFLRARSVHEVGSLRAPARALAGPEAQHHVTPPFAGYVTSVRVQVGDAVTRGQTLAILSLPELATVSARYLNAQTEANLRKRRKARLEELQKGGIGRAQQILDAELALTQVLGEQRLAEARLKAARIPLNATETYANTGGRYALRAPQDGVVRRTAAHPGSAASPDAPLVVIDGPAAVRIEADVAPGLADAGWGQWRFEHDRGGVIVREVGRSPRIDSHTGLRRMWFAPMKTGNLTALSGASGTLRPDSPEKLMVVPEKALTLRVLPAPAADAAEVNEVAAARGPPVAVTVRTDDGLVAHDVQVIARVAGLAIVQGLAGPVTVALKNPDAP